MHSQPASEQRAGLGASIEGLLVARCTARAALRHCVVPRWPATWFRSGGGREKVSLLLPVWVSGVCVPMLIVITYLGYYGDNRMANASNACQIDPKVY
eukprot:COSAG02_NODE_1810_length_10825_cov_43.150848_3_plen_98_part_00